MKLLRALITGVSGFAGSHLAEHLHQQTDWELFGLSRRAPSPASAAAWLTELSCDLRDRDQVQEAVARARPDLVFHLAGQAAPSQSFADPAGTFDTNVRGQLHLLEALRAAGLHPRTLIVGSGDEYGLVDPDDLPIDEDTPFRPNSAYAVSKIAQDFLGLQYFLTYGLPVVRVRPFNHVGPRQSADFVAGAFARQLAEIEAGRREPVLRVGNLEARRDFTSVRDIVRAYHLAVLSGEPGEVYNIGSGRARSVRELLDCLLALVGGTVDVVVDPSRYRPADVPEVVCDYTRFKGLTGWEPEQPIEKALSELLNYWRGEVRNQA